jgi:hypothetical protein
MRKNLAQLIVIVSTSYGAGLAAMVVGTAASLCWWRWLIIDRVVT